MRPLQLIHDEDHAWMTSSPHYGTLGGALSRIDLNTGEVEVFRNLVQDQTPVRMLMAPDRKTLYLSMTIEGDCGSAIARGRSAHLVVFDVASRQLIHSFAPFREARVLALWAFTPDGKIVFGDRSRLAPGGCLSIWDPETNSIRRVGPAPEGMHQVIPSPDGKQLWASGYAGIGPLILGDPCRIESVIDTEVAAEAFDRVCKSLQWEGNRLWFSTGTEFAFIEAPGSGC